MPPTMPPINAEVTPGERASVEGVATPPAVLVNVEPINAELPSCERALVEGVATPAVLVNVDVSACVVLADDGVVCCNLVVLGLRDIPAIVTGLVVGGNGGIVIVVVDGDVTVRVDNEMATVVGGDGRVVATVTVVEDEDDGGVEDN
jgi:hypothetical protein